MKLFIPALGTALRLTKPWSFTLYCEPRNKSLWDLISPIPMDGIDYFSRRGGRLSVELQPGDRLVIDRVFIRKGSAAYNSVTFKGGVHIKDVYHTVRFWATLEDANNIECFTEVTKND